MLTRTLATAAFLATTLACSAATGSIHPGEVAAGDRAALLLTASDAEASPDCRVRVGATPSVASLADSAALHAEIVRRWPDAAGDTLVLSIHVDSAGIVQWAQVLDSAGDRLTPDAAREVVERHVRPLRDDSTASGWYHRFRLSGGPDPVIQAGPSVHCRPSVLNASALSRRMQTEIESHGPAVARYIQGMRSATLRMFVADSGQPTRIEVYRSSGYRDLDAIAVRVAQNARFEPGRVDGRPIPVWVQIPMSFNMPEAARSRGSGG